LPVKQALDDYPWQRDAVSQWFQQPLAARDEVVDARLRRAWSAAWRQIPFFQRRWQSHGLVESDFSGRADLAALPTTDIDEYRESIADHPPFGDVVDETLTTSVATILTSGGTTGFPRPVPVTTTARSSAALLAARTFVFVGVGPADVVQVTSTFSTHGAAWIAAWGVDVIGATLVPTSSGAVTRSREQIELMRYFGTTVLRASPAYARILASTATEMGFSPAELGVRIIVTAGEVVSPATRRYLEEIWGARVFDLYGTMETLVWSSIDCSITRETGGASGMHVWDDAIVLEVLRPDGSACDDGEYGELTVTSWLCDVGPKFRYRMGDRVAMTHEPCLCGLDTPRLLPVAGRLDDCLRIRGQNIWPASLEDVVRQSVPECADYVLIADRVADRDRLKLVMTETVDGSTSGQSLASAQQRLKAVLGVTIELELAAAATVAELNGAGSNGKTRRIIDRRAH
jgi:phenylacetate-CoA ligase